MRGPQQHSKDNKPQTAAEEKAGSDWQQEGETAAHKLQGMVGGDGSQGAVGGSVAEVLGYLPVRAGDEEQSRHGSENPTAPRDTGETRLQGGVIAEPLEDRERVHGSRFSDLRQRATAAARAISARRAGERLAWRLRFSATAWGSLARVFLAISSR